MRSAISSHGPLLATLLLLAPWSASAQTTTGDTSNTNPLGLSKANFTITFEAFADGRWSTMNKTTFDTYFNRARCECNTQVRVRVRLDPALRNKIGASSGLVRLRAGDDTCVCSGAACAAINCRDIGTEQDIIGLANDSLVFPFSVQGFFLAGRTATADTSVCDAEHKQNVWLFLDTNQDDNAFPDLNDVSEQVDLDGRAPPAPTGLKVSPGDDALHVSWNNIQRLADFQGYQVLCARGGELAPFPGKFQAKYETPTVCPAREAGGADAGVTSVRDAGADGSASSTLARTSDTTTSSYAITEMRGPAPPKLAALDPAFVCSDLLTSQSETRLFRLQNNIPYAVGVVAIDKRSNPSAIAEVVVQAPAPTRDFYVGYRSAGGAAEGGYCSFGRGASSPAPLPWAVLGGALGLAGLGRRRTQVRKHGQKTARLGQQQ